MIREHPSLRAHLIGMLAVFAAIFLGLTVYLYVTSRLIFSEALEHELKGDLEWVVATTEHDASLLTIPHRTDSLFSLVTKFKGFRFTLIDTSGKVLADSYVPKADVEGMENHLNRAEIKDASINGSGKSWRVSSTLGVEMLYVAQKLQYHRGYLRVAAGPTSLKSFQTASIRVFVLFLALFLAASIVVTVWISRKISSPLLNLGDGTTPKWEAEFREADILNQAFEGYVKEIRKLGGEIEKERDKLVAVLNQLEEGIIILSEEGIILAANPSSLKLIGVQPTPSALAEWIGKRAKEVLSNQTLINWIAGSQAKDRPPLLHLDKGPEAPYDLLCHLAILDSGQPTREYLLTLINVSEFRHLDRVKSEFVANASHELKTPLSSIKGYTETLLDGALLDPKVREPFVKKIHSNALRLERLVQDLLSLSHLEANPIPKETEALPLRSYANSAANLHRQGLEATGIRFENHIAEDIWVLMEPRDLELILNNLVGNAVKYNRPGGKVKLWVDIDTSVKLSVKDTGIGIPEEMLPRIFERFYRAGASRASKEGTGLGLAIVKHAAHKYQMNVSAESILGEGSRFIVEIPMALVQLPTIKIVVV